MQLVKIKKRRRVLWKAFFAKTFFEKALGLMFQKKAFPLLFEFESQGTSRNSIHSLFCPPFDAIFLNSRKQVVFVIENIKPFSLVLYSPYPSKYLIELPPGEARKAHLRKGDWLEWNNKSKRV